MVYPGGAAPRSKDPEWPLIGYDVADAARLSGLSNCYYSGDQDDRGAEQYAEHLNDKHLFSNLEQAMQYCLVTDIRVPEHAPFFVYGLYRVAEVRRD